MDDKTLDELKSETTVDNSKLEELMAEEITPQMQRKFFEVFKESRLFLPIDFGPDAFKGIEDADPGDIVEGPRGFSIAFLTDGEGKKAVPLFTSEGMMQQAGIQTSVMVIYMSDLAGMLKQSDEYSVIAVNPFTDHDLNIPIGAFLALFEEEFSTKEFAESLEALLKLLKENSIELEENCMFYLRAEDDVMMKNAVDGVFTPDVPFTVSSSEEYNMDMKYLNLIAMPKGTRILFLGGVVEEGTLDVVIAPGSEFFIGEKPNQYTTVWECRAQPFYDED